MSTLSPLVYGQHTPSGGPSSSDMNQSQDTAGAKVQPQHVITSILQHCLFNMRNQNKELKSARPLGRTWFGKVGGSRRPPKARQRARVTCRQLCRSESGKLLALLWQAGTRGDTEGTASLFASAGGY